MARSAACVIALALCGCGGGGEGSSEAPSATVPPSMSGTVSDGVVMDMGNFRGLDVGVKGSAGIARETSAVTVTTHYNVTLDQLAPPYLLSANVLDGIRLLAPATRDGTANLTPLTTLTTAWLLGTDPAAYFDNTLAGQGGVPAFTDAEVATAQAEVTRYLARVSQVELNSSIASQNWVTTPMQNAPGDAMFDQIVVLNNALTAATSSLAQLAGEVAAQKQRCSRTRVAVTGGIAANHFCQKDSSSQFMSGNLVRVFNFADIEGSTLALRVKNGAVIRIAYVTREGSFGCDSQTACAGATVGALTADDTVPITLAGVQLRAQAGTKVALDGALAGAGALPTLPCDNDKFYLLDPAGGVRGLCMYEAGANKRASQADYNWGSQDGDQPYYLELVSDGTSVASIDVWWYDPETGNPLTLYRCEQAACTGVTISEPLDSVDEYGDPLRARNFALHNVPMSAVDSEGRLGSAVAMTVTATLSNRVPGAGFTPDCSTSIEHNTVSFSDSTPALDVCPPPPSSDDYYTFKSAYPYYVPGIDDAVDFSVSTYVVPIDGSVSPLNTIHVVLSGNTVLKIFLQTAGDTRSFSCLADACAGVTVSALDDQGQRTIGFNGTVLLEDPVRQIPGAGTTAVITGGFLSVSDPYFVPLSVGGRRAVTALPSRPRQARAAPGFR
ncbi:hypothetical protein GCM10009107_17280 [Ideonella azotifigens]|uniref:Lipoprotein n=2 Tax=Ideonella azotifigens TaxID=513160 RepID=A0ABN1JWP2_9BURK